MRCSWLILFLLCAPVVSAQDVASDSSGYHPGYALPEDGSEVVVVYFGGSTCAPCSFPGFRAALRKAVLRLQERTEAAGKSFAFVGVANDWDVEAGLEFLESNGPFDEIVVGRNWFNTLSAEHLFMNEQAQAALPTLIVYEQEITRRDGQPYFAGKRYQTALIGAEVIWWVERDVPLPYSFAEDLAGMTEEEREAARAFISESYTPEP